MEGVGYALGLEEELFLLLFLVKLVGDVGLVEGLSSGLNNASCGEMNAVSVDEWHAIEVCFVLAYTFDEVAFICWDVKDDDYAFEIGMMDVSVGRGVFLLFFTYDEHVRRLEFFFFLAYDECFNKSDYVLFDLKAGAGDLE